jgi:hypothetical protein
MRLDRAGWWSAYFEKTKRGQEMNIRTFVLLLFTVSLSLPAVAGELAPPKDPKLLPSLIAKSEGKYNKLSEQVYSVMYHSKEMGTVNVIIGASGDMLSFGAPVIDRSKLSLSKNFLLKLVEMNTNYDYTKICLDNDSLDVRIDALAAGMTLENFQFLENQVAMTAEAVYKQVKDFLP